jgi:hypothetical protein
MYTISHDHRNTSKDPKLSLDPLLTMGRQDHVGGAMEKSVDEDLLPLFAGVE